MAKTRKPRDVVQSERINSTEVSRLTGFSLRKVQMLAEGAKIPTAARLGGGCWTFDAAAVRDWIRRGEGALCQTISTGGAKFGGQESRFGGVRSDDRYEQLLARKRASASQQF